VPIKELVDLRQNPDRWMKYFYTRRPRVCSHLLCLPALPSQSAHESPPRRVECIAPQLGDTSLELLRDQWA
jgi:hypothetical protein